MEFIGPHISAEAYDVLWEWAVPGLPKPAVLLADSPGDTTDQRRQIVASARTELIRAGYARPRGVLDEVTAVLTMVGRPQVAVDVRLYEWTPATEHEPARPVRFGARVTASAWRGATAMLGPDWFRTSSFPGGSLVDEVIRLFAHYEAPARFSGFSIHPDDLAVRPARRVEQVLQLLEGPCRRRAHICVVSRDPVAGAERVSDSLVLNDNYTGTYLVFMARNEITIVPGQRGTLERKLKELLDPTPRY